MTMFKKYVKCDLVSVKVLQQSFKIIPMKVSLKRALDSLS